MQFHHMHIICLYYINTAFYLYDVFLVIIYYSHVSNKKAVNLYRSTALLIFPYSVLSFIICKTQMIHSTHNRFSKEALSGYL